MDVNTVKIYEGKLNNSRTTFTEAVGKEIHKLRKERSMTGKELAILVNVSQQQISRYECGVCNLTVDTLIIILNVLNVPLTDFFNQVFLRAFETEKKTLCKISQRVYFCKSIKSFKKTIRNIWTI